MILTSKNNPLVKETASLKEKKGRKTLGMFLVEGVKMSQELLKSGLELDRAFVSETFAGETELPSDKTVTVSEDILRFLSDEKTPQGVVCRVRLPQTAVRPPRGACLLLDGVADPGNVGAIVRSANAAGYKEIYLTKDCADAFSPKSVRASMSGLFFTKLYIGEREELLTALADTPILVADMRGENVFSYVPPEKFALVIGNEANGVSEKIKNAAAHSVRIPMRETQESLNAAVSAGILMYELKRREFTE